MLKKKLPPRKVYTHGCMMCPKCRKGCHLCGKCDCYEVPQVRYPQR